MRALLLCVALCLGVTSSPAARVFRVGPDHRYPTIQAAIELSVSGDIIEIVEGVYGESPIIVRRDITLLAVDHRPVVIDASIKPDVQSAGSALRIVGSNVRLEGLTLRNGDGNVGAGLALFSGSAVLYKCKLENNLIGGLIIPNVIPGSIEFQSCLIRGNGIGVLGQGQTILRNCVLTGNRFALSSSGIVEIYDTRVISNGFASDKDSGALSVSGMGRLERIQVRHNFSNGQSGGIFATDSGPFFIVDCVVENNQSTNGSSGIIIDGADRATITNCIVRNNVASGPVVATAGLTVRRTHAVVEGCQILNNVGEDSGGGVSVQLNSSLLMRNSIVVNNRSMNRGGGIFVSRGSAQLEEVVVAGNESILGGGLATENSGELVVIQSTLAGNKAAAGAALFLGSGPVSFDSSIIAFHKSTSVFLCFQAATFKCSNVFSNSSEGLCGTDQGGNLFLNPQFCGFDPESGRFDLGLSTESPLANVVGCGRIGAQPADCSTTNVQSSLWGEIKTLYR